MSTTTATTTATAAVCAKFGTAASCTSEAVVAAVAAGGVITFDCGPEPVVITLISMFAVVNGALVQIIMGSRVLFGMANKRVLRTRSTRWFICMT